MCAVLLIASCEQSPVVEQSILNQPEEFWATFEGADESDTRTYLDDQARMRWTADDRLTIFKKTTYNREFAFTGKTGANAGGFKQVSVDDDFWFGYDVDYNYAIYPHSAANEFDETNCFFTTTMPAEQTYVENSFGLGANTMVAVSESGQLIFKNVGSYLRVMLWGENQTVKKITLNSIAGEALAGEAKIFATLADAPTCTMIDDISSITLTCETPVEINATEEEPVAFWIVVPPVVLSEGYTVTVENAEGETQTYEVNKEKTFKRNVYNTLRRELTIGVVEEPTVPANNEIWYTSTTGEVVTPHKTDVFGANIVSNTYENGKGVITFDGEVTSIGDYAFQVCKSLTGIIMPHSVMELGIFAFADCSSLTSVTFGDGVKTIKNQAFDGCKALENITIGNSVTSIGYYAFWHCTSLASVTIPDSVTEIGDGAFCECI